MKIGRETHVYQPMLQESELFFHLLLGRGRLGCLLPFFLGQEEWGVSRLKSQPGILTELDHPPVQPIVVAAFPFVSLVIRLAESMSTPN